MRTTTEAHETDILVCPYDTEIDWKNLDWENLATRINKVLSKDRLSKV